MSPRFRWLIRTEPNQMFCLVCHVTSEPPTVSPVRMDIFRRGKTTEWRDISSQLDRHTEIGIVCINMIIKKSFFDWTGSDCGVHLYVIDQIFLISSLWTETRSDGWKNSLLPVRVPFIPSTLILFIITLEVQEHIRPHILTSKIFQRQHELSQNGRRLIGRRKYEIINQM